MPSDKAIDVYIRVEKEGKAPLYATPGSAGCDLFLSRSLTLLPGESKVLPLDFRMALPAGVEAQIRPRSGLSLQTSLRLCNSPGTIDSDYRDLVGVIAQNTAAMDPAAAIACDPKLALVLQKQYEAISLADYLQSRGADPTPLATNLAGRKVYVDAQGYLWGTLNLAAGQRIAQMVFCRYLQARFLEHEAPETLGSDRGGGFGSTGL